MTRDESLVRLEALNRELKSWEAAPLFTQDTIESLSGHGLRLAVKLTEDHLMRVTKRVNEQ